MSDREEADSPAREYTTGLLWRALLPAEVTNQAIWFGILQNWSLHYYKRGILQKYITDVKCFYNGYVCRSFHNGTRTVVESWGFYNGTRVVVKITQNLKRSPYAM